MILDRANSRLGPANAVTGNVGYHSKRIQAGLSTQIVVSVVDELGTKYVIGAIQEMTINQARGLTEISEVGTDGCIQIVPTSATKFTATLNRMIFDFQRLPQALQRDFRIISAQRRPFDIVITDYNPYLTGINQAPTITKTVDGTESVPALAPTTDFSMIETTLVNCWFSSLAMTLNQGTFTVVENSGITFEAMVDTTPPIISSQNSDPVERAAGTTKTASVMSQADRIPTAPST